MNDALSLITALIISLLFFIILFLFPKRQKEFIVGKALKIINDVEKSLSKFLTFITSIQIKLAKRTTYNTIHLVYIINRAIYFIGVGLIGFNVYLIVIETSPFFTKFGASITNFIITLFVAILIIKIFIFFLKFLVRDQQITLFKNSLTPGFNENILRSVYRLSRLIINLSFVTTLTINLSQWPLINNKTLEKLALYIIAVIMIKEILCIINRVSGSYISRTLTYLIMSASVPKAGIGSYPFLTYEKLIDNPDKELCNAYAENFDTSKLTIIKTINGHTTINKTVQKYDMNDNVIFPVENYSFVIKIEGISAIWETFTINHLERPIFEENIVTKSDLSDVIVDKVKAFLKNKLHFNK